MELDNEGNGEDCDGAEQGWILCARGTTLGVDH